jgi:hypothetical protein
MTMNNRNNDSASFVDFFRSVSFSSPRTSTAAGTVDDRHFYVPQKDSRNTVKKPAEDSNLVRSDN